MRITDVSRRQLGFAINEFLQQLAIGRSPENAFAIALDVAAEKFDNEVPVAFRHAQLIMPESITVSRYAVTLAEDEVSELCELASDDVIPLEEPVVNRPPYIGGRTKFKIDDEVMCMGQVFTVNAVRVVLDPDKDEVFYDLRPPGAQHEVGLTNVPEDEIELLTERSSEHG